MEINSQTMSKKIPPMLIAFFEYNLVLLKILSIIILLLFHFIARSLILNV